MESQFSAAVDAAKQTWSFRYPNRLMEDQDVLEDVCTKLYGDWRRRQTFVIPDTPRSTKASSALRTAAIDIQQPQQQVRFEEDEEEESEDRTQRQQERQEPRPSLLAMPTSLETYSKKQVREFNIRVAALQATNPHGSHRGRDRDRDRGGGRDKRDRSRSPSANPEMEGRCFVCGMPGCHSQSCIWLNREDLNKYGKPRLNYAKLCAHKPADAKKTLLDSLQKWGRLKSIKDPVYAAELRTRLEADSWVPSSKDY
jgi:hypothetical protein